MKAAALMILLTAASTCSSPVGKTTDGKTTGGKTTAEPSGGPVEFRTVKSGGYAATTPSQPQAHLAADAATYKQLWDSLIGNGEAPPDVAFGKETIVFFLAGQRNSGGYGIDVKGGTLEGSTLVVAAEVKGPPPGSMVTQALTSPWSVVAFETTGAKDVRWQR